MTSQNMKLMYVISISIALIGVIFFVGLPRNETSSITNPSIQESINLTISPESVDFGDMVRSQGVVTASIQIENMGTYPIKLARLSTSCGCTTAEMDMTDLAPNETRDMKISFDPNVHPDQVGEIIRVVYLQVVEPFETEIEIDVTGNVLPTQDNKIL